MWAGGPGKKAPGSAGELLNKNFSGLEDKRGEKKGKDHKSSQKKKKKKNHDDKAGVMSGSDRELDRMERAKNNQSGNPNEGGAPAASSLDSAAHKVHASRPENMEAPPASASSVVFSTAPRTAQEVVAQLSSGSSASARQSPKTKPRIFALGDNSPIEDQDAILSLHARTNIHAAVPVRIDFDDKLRPRGGGAAAASRAGGAVPAVHTTAFFLSPASSCSSSPKTEKRKYLRSPRDGGKSRDLGKSRRARDDDFASKEDSYRVYMREDRAVLGSHEDAKAMEKLGKWLSKDMDCKR